MSFQIRNPAFDEKVRQIITRAPFIQDLGVELVRIEPGVCETRLAIVPRLLQQDGFVHAGVAITLGDHTAGAASGSLVGPDETVLTVDLHAALLRPATGRALRCVARVLRPGRSITVAQSEVFAVDEGGAERSVVALTVTLAVVAMRT